MAYIGKTPITGNFKLDTISVANGQAGYTGIMMALFLQIMKM